MNVQNSAEAEAGKPLTVLALAPAHSYGGLERTTHDIATGLIRAGGRALIAAPATPAARRLSASGADLIEINFAARNMLLTRTAGQRLAEIARSEGVDVIHARSRSAAAIGKVAAAAAGCAFVTTWPRVYGRGGPSTKALAAGAPVIAVSDFVAQHLAEVEGLGADKVISIPRGVDMDRFAEGGVPAGRVIRQADLWALTEDPRPVIMVPGRLVPENGHEILIPAIARLVAERGENFLCLIVGEGKERYRAALEAKIRRAGIGQVLRIVGPVEDMPAALKLSALVAVPATRPKASARVAIEAAAMGRPVVAAAHGAVMEVVKEGETGWLPPPADEEALAAALSRALDLDESARAHIGNSGRALVRARFTLQAMQDAVLEVYRRAAAAAVV